MAVSNNLLTWTSVFPPDGSTRGCMVLWVRGWWRCRCRMSQHSEWRRVRWGIHRQWFLGNWRFGRNTVLKHEKVSKIFLMFLKKICIHTEIYKRFIKTCYKRPKKRATVSCGDTCRFERTGSGGSGLLGAAGRVLVGWRCSDRKSRAVDQANLQPTHFTHIRFPNYDNHDCHKITEWIKDQIRACTTQKLIFLIHPWWSNNSVFTWLGELEGPLDNFKIILGFTIGLCLGKVVILDPWDLFVGTTNIFNNIFLPYFKFICISLQKWKSVKLT